MYAINALDRHVNMLISESTQPNAPKRSLIYCSRTVQEIEKALEELSRLMEYRQKVSGKEELFLGLGLSARKNLCIHPSVSQETRGTVVDARCMSMTSSWSRQSSKKSSDLCEFFEVNESQ